MKQGFNHLIQAIQGSDIRAFDAEVSSIPDIIKLTLGEPNFPTPEHIKQAAIQAILDNQSKYTPNNGIPALRQAAADYYREKFGLDYGPDQVITTIGATEGIHAALQTLLNEGEVVIVPTPVFPYYLPVTQVQRGQYVLEDTSETGFRLRPDRLEELILEIGPDKAKVLILVYPSNPTGVTYSRQELEALAQVCRKYDMWVLCDEIYAELTYTKTHVSMSLLYPERTVVVTGLSKSHAMTGWRIGYVFGPQDFIDQAIKSHQYMVTSPATVSQYAALEAMTKGQEDCQAMMVEYSQRRQMLIEELTKVGFQMADPDGAFYLFAKIPPQAPQNSWDFVRDLAYKAKVALIPGASFGPGGEGYVRISYAASMEDLQEAARRIQEYVAAL